LKRARVLAATLIVLGLAMHAAAARAQQPELPAGDLVLPPPEVDPSQFVEPDSAPPAERAETEETADESSAEAEDSPALSADAPVDMLPAGPPEPGGEALSAEPPSDGNVADQAPNPNPLGGLTLEGLSATRTLPLFTPSRTAPVLEAEPPPEPAAPEPEVVVEEPPPSPPALRLIGIMMAAAEQVALLANEASGETVRLRPGESFEGWTMRILDTRSVEFSNGDQLQKLTMFEPGTEPPPSERPSSGDSEFGEPLDPNAQAYGDLPEEGGEEQPGVFGTGDMEEPEAEYDEDGMLIEESEDEQPAFPPGQRRIAPPQPTLEDTEGDEDTAENGE